jgi:hypothetical protein
MGPSDSLEPGSEKGMRDVEGEGVWKADQRDGRTTAGEDIGEGQGWGKRAPILDLYAMDSFQISR